MKPARKKQPTSVLGLAFDGSWLEGVEVRRTNGSVEIRKSFSVSLTLDPLTGAPELVGREIRIQLDAAGIKERHCTVCLPLNWALTLTAPLPDLGEEDVDSFLQIEAERGFPYGLDALSLDKSRFRTAGGEQATLVAVPLDHITRLESVLSAAKLRTVSFSLGITALQRPEAETSESVLALVPGENSIGLLVAGGGGIVVLRSLEGAYEMDGSERQLQADQIARELRITLGNLPREMAGSVQRLRVFGKNDSADELAEQLRPRVQALGLKVEQVRDCASAGFSVQVPSGTPVSSALALAVRVLSGQPGMEFLPPKISQWKVLAAKYSSGKLVWAGAAAAGIVLLIGLAFGVQQGLLWYWNGKLTGVKPRADEVTAMEGVIHKYRPWYNEAFPSLSVLRRITEAFPADGVVTAKSLGIQASSTSLRTTEARDPVTITCTGTAKDNNSLLKVLEKMRADKAIKNVTLVGITGTPPLLRFTIKLGFGGPGPIN